MEPISKSVRDRLESQLKSAQEHARADGMQHPDADLLAAYSENALHGREREGIVEHLVLCANCREVVALAAPVLEHGPATVEGKRNWFMVPAFRWAAAAAAIVVVATVMIGRHDSGDANRQIATMSKPANEGPVAPAASRDQAAQPQPATPQHAVVADGAKALPQHVNNELSAAAVPKVPVPSAVPARGRKQESATLADARTGASAQAKPLDELAAAQKSPVYNPSGNTRSSSTSGQVATGGNAGGAVGTHVKPPPGGVIEKAIEQDNAYQMANVVPPPPPPAENAPTGGPRITMRKPPAAAGSQIGGTSDEAKSAPAASVAAPTTPAAGRATVTSESVQVEAPALAKSNQPRAELPPERRNSNVQQDAVVFGATVPVTSSDTDVVLKTAGVICSAIPNGVRCAHPGKRTTEYHVENAHFTAIAALGNMLWAGGDALVRSTDSGETWNPVIKPSGETITAISVLPKAVVITTTSGRRWQSLDGGATWTPVAQTPK